MPQNTTTLPTGIRAFNAVTADVTEATALFVQSTDGGLLALKELDGVSAGAVTVPNPPRRWRRRGRRPRARSC